MAMRRSGFWTHEEVMYAQGLACAFELGVVEEEDIVSPPTTMRDYVAKKLQCNGMRVTKKGVCHQQGKFSFAQSPARSDAQKRDAQAQLRVVEHVVEVEGQDEVEDGVQANPHDNLHQSRSKKDLVESIIVDVSTSDAIPPAQNICKA